jgi:hypothetical protein
MPTRVSSELFLFEKAAEGVPPTWGVDARCCRRFWGVRE